jgi:hypothetical protein
MGMRDYSQGANRNIQYESIQRLSMRIYKSVDNYDLLPDASTQPPPRMTISNNSQCAFTLVGYCASCRPAPEHTSGNNIRRAQCHDSHRYLFARRAIVLTRQRCMCCNYKVVDVLSLILSEQILQAIPPTLTSGHNAYDARTFFSLFIRYYNRT